MAGCTVLGPIRAFDAEGCELTLVSEPQRRLLAILCLHVGSVVRSAALEEHLSLSAGALRTSISRLRRAIGPDVLVSGPAGYELRADVDVVAYEQLVSEAHDADAVSSRTALERARSLWQGTPYDEFAHEPWAKVEVCRLGELHAAAMEELVALLLDAGDDAAAMAILVPLIDEHPYRDPLRGLLMPRAVAGRAHDRGVAPVPDLPGPASRRHRRRTLGGPRRSRPRRRRRWRPGSALRTRPSGVGAPATTRPGWRSRQPSQPADADQFVRGPGTRDRRRRRAPPARRTDRRGRRRADHRHRARPEPHGVDSTSPGVRSRWHTITWTGPSDCASRSSMQSIC